MATFQYFRSVDGQYPGSKMPDPQGALAQEVPSHAISAANTEVALLQEAGGAKVSTRGMYLKMISQKKAEIGKRAAEYGVFATDRYYARRHPEPLRELGAYMEECVHGTTSKTEKGRERLPKG